MQFKMYSAVGRYRKNSYGGNSNPMGFGRECFSSMSAKILGGGGGGGEISQPRSDGYGLTLQCIVWIFETPKGYAQLPI